MLLNFFIIYINTPSKDKSIYITYYTIDKKAI